MRSCEFTTEDIRAKLERGIQHYSDQDLFILARKDTLQ